MSTIEDVLGPIPPSPYPPGYRKRMVLPLTTPQPTRVGRGVEVRISAAPTRCDFILEQLVIGGNPAHWIVKDILIEGVSQLECKDLPGALFAGRGVARAGQPGTTRLQFTDFPPIRRREPVDRDPMAVKPGDGLTIVVAYVGPNPEGEAFYGTAVGRPPDAVTSIAITTTAPIRTAEQPTTVWFRPSVPFIPRRFVVDGAGWIVCDIRIGGVSQLSPRPAEIPGEAFAKSASPIVFFTPCRKDAEIEVDVRYVGDDPEGAVFAAHWDADNDLATMAVVAAGIGRIASGVDVAISSTPT